MISCIADGATTGRAAGGAVHDCRTGTDCRPVGLFDRTVPKSFTEQYRPLTAYPVKRKAARTNERSSDTERPNERPCDKTGARWIDSLREAGYRSGSTPVGRDEKVKVESKSSQVKASRISKLSCDLVCRFAFALQAASFFCHFIRKQKHHGPNPHPARPRAAAHDQGQGLPAVS